MGLFERTKHLDRLAREIADENLRHLGAPPLDEARTRRELLDLERILREYRLNREEALARRQVALEREESAREKAGRWLENARLAVGKSRPDLEEQARARAADFERDRAAAHAVADQEGATLARLDAEIELVERRVRHLRALRRGVGAPPPEGTPPRTAGPTTRQISIVRGDPLEEEFERLRGEPDASM